MSGKVIKNNNSVEGIQEISLRESVRLRPGMYLGSIDSRAIVDLIVGLIAACKDV